MAQDVLDPQQEPAVDGMAILEHLDELRIRVTWALGGLAVGTVIAFFFAQAIFRFLFECNFPAILMNADDIKAACGQVQAIRPTETIESFIRIAFTAGVGVAMPWMLLQLWKFIAPGLHKHEKRYVYLFVPAVTLLFFGGVAFAWAILMPPALVFLNSFLADGDNVTIQWTVESYIGFVSGFLLWLGVAFEMPLIFYALSRFGLVSSKMLREHWRYAIVGIAILAAIITPSIDPVTMMLTMAPLTVLYLFSILLSWLGYRQFTRR